MIKIIAFGKIKELYLENLIKDYAKRINKFHKLEIIELADENNLEKEKDLLLKKLNNKDYLVVLDIKGKELNSLEFSNLIDKTFINYNTITFVIGSSDGIHQSIKEKANLLLSFSSLTFPHGLFRGILLEQIYRSFKIINNESYHK